MLTKTVQSYRHLTAITLLLVCAHVHAGPLATDVSLINLDQMNISLPSAGAYFADTSFVLAGDQKYDGIEICDSPRCKESSGNSKFGYPEKIFDNKINLTYAFAKAIHDGKMGLFGSVAPEPEGGFFLPGGGLTPQLLFLAKRYNSNCVPVSESSNELSEKCPKDVRDFVAHVDAQSKNDMPLPPAPNDLAEKGRRKMIIDNPDFAGKVNFIDAYGCKSTDAPTGKFLGTEEYNCYKQKLFTQCPFLVYQEIEMDKFKEYNDTFTRLQEDKDSTQGVPGSELASREEGLKITAQEMSAAKANKEKYSSNTNLNFDGMSSKQCSGKFESLRKLTVMPDRNSCLWNQNGSGGWYSVASGICTGRAGCSTGVNIPLFDETKKHWPEDKSIIYFDLSCPAVDNKCPAISSCLFQQKATPKIVPPMTRGDSTGVKSE